MGGNSNLSDHSGSKAGPDQETISAPIEFLSRLDNLQN